MNTASWYFGFQLNSPRVTASGAELETRRGSRSVQSCGEMDRRTSAHAAEGTVGNGRAVPVSRRGGVRRAAVQGPGLKAGVGSSVLHLQWPRDGPCQRLSPALLLPSACPAPLVPRSPGNLLCKGVRPLTRFAPATLTTRHAGCVSPQAHIIVQKEPFQGWSWGVSPRDSKLPEGRAVSALADGDPRRFPDKK